MDKKLKWIAKYYQKIEIEEKDLIQKFLEHIGIYFQKNLLYVSHYKEILTVDNINKLTIKTYDINDCFFITFHFKKDNTNQTISIDYNIILDYLSDNNLINAFPKQVVLTKIPLLDTRIRSVLLKYIGKDICHYKILTIVPDNILNNPELLDKYLNKLIRFGFKKENIFILDINNISDYNNLELDLVYVDDFDVEEIVSNLKNINYLETLNNYIKSGVTYLGIKNGINLGKEFTNLGDYNLEDDDILVICEDDYVKYEFKDYILIFEKKRSVENFKKIIEDLEDESEICLKLANQKYFIVKYKNYVTFYKEGLSKELKFKNIDELINTDIFDINLKKDFNKIESIIIDECLEI